MRNTSAENGFKNNEFKDNGIKGNVYLVLGFVVFIVVSIATIILRITRKPANPVNTLRNNDEPEAQTLDVVEQHTPPANTDASNPNDVVPPKPDSASNSPLKTSSTTPQTPPTPPPQSLGEDLGKPQQLNQVEESQPQKLQLFMRRVDEVPTPMASPSNDAIDEENTWATLQDRDKVAFSTLLLSLGLPVFAPSNSTQLFLNSIVSRGSSPVANKQVETKQENAENSSIPTPTPSPSPIPASASSQPRNNTKHLPRFVFGKRIFVVNQKTLPEFLEKELVNIEKQAKYFALQEEEALVANLAESFQEQEPAQEAKKPKDLRENKKPKKYDKDKNIKELLVRAPKEQVKLGALQNVFYEFLNSKIKNANQDSNDDENSNAKKIVTIIQRENNHDERFFPTLFAYDKSGPLGVFTYMWSSDPTKLPWHPINKGKKFARPFTGFERFVTALCMFGTHLVGRTNANVQRPLIKHDNIYHEGEKVESVFELQDDNPYEALIFRDFELYLQMINSYTKDNSRKTLICHVPWADYMLIGVDMYLKSKITLEALGQFFKLVLKKGREYHHAIKKACENQDISFEILSPLSSLFAEEIVSINERPKCKVLREKEDINVAKIILEQLGFTVGNDDKVTQPFVKTMLTKLVDGSHPHAQLWQKFLTQEGVASNINTIENLFDIANAFVIAHAALDLGRDSVCSILPLSEKPIQIEYKKLAEELNLPAVFFLTVMDTLMGYDEQNKSGMLFYHQNNYHDVTLAARNKVLSEDVHRRIGFFVHGNSYPAPAVQNPSPSKSLTQSARAN